MPIFYARAERLLRLGATTRSGKVTMEQIRTQVASGVRSHNEWHAQQQQQVDKNSADRKAVFTGILTAAAVVGGAVAIGMSGRSSGNSQIAPALNQLAGNATTNGPSSTSSGAAVAATNAAAPSGSQGYSEQSVRNPSRPQSDKPSTKPGASSSPPQLNIVSDPVIVAQAAQLRNRQTAQGEQTRVQRNIADEARTAKDRSEQGERDGCYIPHHNPSCVIVERTKWQKDEFIVTYRNHCEAGIYMGFCNLQKDGNASCGADHVRQGGSMSWNSFNSTGAYAYKFTGSRKSQYDWICGDKNHDPMFDSQNLKHELGAK
jgi:hypothetical protein